MLEVPQPKKAKKQKSNKKAIEEPDDIIIESIMD
jgi:hypothetical protein